MYRLKRKALKLSLVPALLLLAAWPAAADLASDVAGDLEPVSGVLVLPASEQSVIDLAAEDGVQAGDLFSVVGKGEKITHPKTGETLGTLDTVKGVLRVHKVEKEFSLAEPVEEEDAFARGDTVKRFFAIPAVFWDYSGGGEPLFRRLKNVLPDLEWSAYSQAQETRPDKPKALSDDGATLLFVLTERETLEVRDNRFELLYEYDVPPGLLDTTSRSKKNAQAPPSAIVSPPTPAPSSGIVQVETPVTDGVWYGPDFERSIVGVEIGELGGREGFEVATLFEHRLEIGRFQGQTYKKTAEVDLSTGQKALLIDGADLDGDGILELYVTASSDGQLASMVVERTDSGFKVTEDFIRWYFRKMSLPGEGPTLLAQRMGTPRQDFAGPVFRVRRNGGELIEGEPVELPRKANVLNFTPLAEDKTAFARLSPLGELQVVDQDGDQLWQSTEDLGGSEAYIERPDPDEAPQTGDSTRHHYMTARMLKLDGDTVLVPVNEGTDFISRQRKFKKSRLKAMHWNGHVMTELWHTRPVDAYLSDFRIADVNSDGTEEILMSLVFTRKGLFKKGRSSLMAVELP